ncbi:hypothetical protein BWK69_01270 [Candidatus Parcubacteria bacterium A4]|nr:MAG: hypothetical protein BWK69_01270 [Candidatus Parcubacteria bacterium A4]
MKFYIVNNLKESIKILMRRAGYRFQDEAGEDLEMSFVRPLKRDIYPRFHAFLTVSQEKSEIIFDLHLDQKKASYEGTSAHSGEYIGDLVQTEADRLRKIFNENGSHTGYTR